MTNEKKIRHATLLRLWEDETHDIRQFNAGDMADVEAAANINSQLRRAGTPSLVPLTTSNDRGAGYETVDLDRKCHHALRILVIGVCAV